MIVVSDQLVICGYLPIGDFCMLNSYGQTMDPNRYQAINRNRTRDSDDNHFSLHSYTSLNYRLYRITDITQFLVCFTELFSFSAIFVVNNTDPSHLWGWEKNTSTVGPAVVQGNWMEPLPNLIWICSFLLCRRVFFFFLFASWRYLGGRWWSRRGPRDMAQIEESPVGRGSRIRPPYSLRVVKGD